MNIFIIGSQEVAFGYMMRLEAIGRVGERTSVGGMVAKCNGNS